MLVDYSIWEEKRLRYFLIKNKINANGWEIVSEVVLKNKQEVKIYKIIARKWNFPKECVIKNKTVKKY